MLTDICERDQHRASAAEFRYCGRVLVEDILASGKVVRNENSPPLVVDCDSGPNVACIRYADRSETKAGGARSADAYMIDGRLILRTFSLLNFWWWLRVGFGPTFRQQQMPGRLWIDSGHERASQIFLTKENFSLGPFEALVKIRCP
jgi:hypothetical protein